jgi:hypothetical protein
MIMCAKVQQKEILSRISEFGDFNTRPKEMTIDPVTRLYHKQYDLDYEV